MNSVKWKIEESKATKSYFTNCNVSPRGDGLN